MDANTKANLIFIVIGLALVPPIFLTINIAYLSTLKIMPEASFGYADICL